MNLRRLFSLVLLCSLLAFNITGAEAQDASPKIAFISVQNILFNCKDGQGAKEQLTAKQNELQKKFTADGAQLEALAKEIETKQSVWSADVLADKKREATRLERDLKMKAEDAKYELNELRKKVLDPIVKKLDRALKEFGKTEGYTMIIDSDVAARSGMIVYGDNAFDLSEALIKKVDAMK